MATFQLEIVTPEGLIFPKKDSDGKIGSKDVDFLILPGSEGEMGVYAGHTPLMTQLKPGELVFTQNGRETVMAVGEGFVEVTQDAVAILTDMALEADDIDEAVAKDAIARAEAALQNQIADDHEVATVNASLQKSLAQIKVKHRTAKK
ncbi:MAG: ATP synthase F1 subunit epsilon [Chthoniobacteraceae bacterium]